MPTPYIRANNLVKSGRAVKVTSKRIAGKKKHVIIVQTAGERPTKYYISMLSQQAAISLGKGILGELKKVADEDESYNSVIMEILNQLGKDRTTEEVKADEQPTA